MNKKYKVLCIEDEIDVRGDIAEVLKDEGFEVYEADNAEEGLKLFMIAKPDIIVSDILMPEISGYDLLHKIRSMDPKKYNPQIPFIFLSALGHKNDIIKATNLDANDYLIKPVDLDILVAKIREKLRNLESINKSHEYHIKNICDQVSTMLSGEIKTEIDSIIKMISILKNEHYGPLGHRNYYNITNKLYLAIQRMRSILENAMNKKTINSKIQIEEEIIEVNSLIDELVATIIEKTKRKVELDLFNDSIYKIKINPSIFKDVLRGSLIQIFKVTKEEIPIRINYFTDHENNFIIAFHGVLFSSTEEEDNLKINMNFKKIRDKILNQGGDFDVKINKKDMVILINIPEYKVLK